MEENTTQPVPEKASKSQPPLSPEAEPSKKRGKSLLLALLLLAVLLLVGGYIWMQRTSDKDAAAVVHNSPTPQSQANESMSANAAPSPSPQACNDTPTVAMKDNIKAALDTKNTAVFSTYTTNPVKFVIAASEEGGDKTPDEAAVSMAYTHNGTGPWDFSLPAATLAQYDGGFYADYFDATTYVGRSTDKMVAAFDFDCSGKVKQIFISAQEDLLLP